MDEKSKNKIAEMITAEGVEHVYAKSYMFINRNLSQVKSGEDSILMAKLKFHLSVIEYLYCDSEIVSNELNKILDED